MKHLMLYFRKIFSFKSVLTVNDANRSLYILEKLWKAIQSYEFFLQPYQDISFLILFSVLLSY